MTQTSPIVGQLSFAEQIKLAAEIASIVEQAPLFRPTMPRWGTPFSVQMSNCGFLGWVADKSGYRYQPGHPVTGQPWPDMPDMLWRLWEKFADYPALPEACLINFYDQKAKMGLHQDKDEQDFDAPVLSISLGDDARFRLGGLKRTDKAESFTLKSGDVMLLSQATRLAFHGIDKIFPGTSDLLMPHRACFPLSGRINLTLRRVAKLPTV